MLKKILKYTFRTLLVILLVLMLVPALLYIPAVQDFVRGKAVGYASRTLGMDLSVERLRLSFPLRLSVDNTLLSDKGDTLLSCGHLSLDVAVWPLLRKEVAVRSLELAKLAAHYRDSTAGMDLKVAAGQFAVNDCRVGLPAKTVGISRIALTDGDVFLNTAESAPAEKADSAAALPWQIDVGKLTVANLVFGMRTAPAATDLSVRLPGVSRLTFGAGVKKRLMESAANDSMVFPSSIFGGMSQSAVCRRHGRKASISFSTLLDAA